MSTVATKECTTTGEKKVHWWSRTPPVPFDPPGFVAEDARCCCGRHTYAEEQTLLECGINVGTFVDDVLWANT